MRCPVAPGHSAAVGCGGTTQQSPKIAIRVSPILYKKISATVSFMVFILIQITGKEKPASHNVW